ncbi:hypothetical protein PsYK624_077160 [Phanerochaete sordida]|uniref:DUF6532 domain-containing protein n=1 Tax=Phanerochaete sordida TaxID=48140 RepID=A0A9P3GB01_9APHY|nr:hypothetical protein PsYK624_077160 [Phanerochaete sordida]
MYAFQHGRLPEHWRRADKGFQARPERCLKTSTNGPPKDTSRTRAHGKEKQATAPKAVPKGSKKNQLKNTQKSQTTDAATHKKTKSITTKPKKKTKVVMSDGEQEDWTDHDAIVGAREDDPAGGDEPQGDDEQEGGDGVGNRRGEEDGSTFEDDGMEDDRDYGRAENSEEFDEDEEEEERPSRKRRRAHEDDEEEHDEETVTNKRPRGRNTNPRFSASPPRRLAHNLPRPRGHRSKARAQATVGHSGLDLTTPSPPQTPPRSGKEAPTFSPFKIVHRGTKPRLQDASPPTHAIGDRANTLYRVYLATRNAWPDETTSIAEIKACFLKACRDGEAPRRALRLQRDTEYAKYIIAVVKQRGPQLRAEVKGDAQGIVPASYGFSGRKKSYIVDTVEKLLDRAAFTFADVDNRKGQYNHPAFAAVLGTTFFSTPKDEGRGEYGVQFNPVPVPLIALVATAIECALVDWSTGVRITKGNEFTSHPYADVYQRHLTNLEALGRSNPSVLARRQRDLWQQASDYTGLQARRITATSGDLDEDDLKADSEDERAQPETAAAT